MVNYLRAGWVLDLCSKLHLHRKLQSAGSPSSDILGIRMDTFPVGLSGYLFMP